MNKLLIICGPTASGKTNLALKLASKLNGEIISADSRQVYKGMDLSTGKDLPTGCVKKISDIVYEFSGENRRLDYYKINNTKIWLYDIVNPDEEINISIFSYLAGKVIKDIRLRGKLPVIVGGSGLYINSIIKPPQTLNIPPDNRLRSDYSKLDIAGLQNILRGLSPDVLAHLNNSDRNNPRRLIRKIEIAKALRASKTNSLKDSREEILQIGLTAPFEYLYNRIDLRVDDRVKKGIVNEIAGLLDYGYGFGCPSFNAIGIKEWKEYFVNNTKNIDISKIIQSWKYHEHGLARRQMTWFKKNSDINWFDIRERKFAGSVMKTIGKWYNI